jgi:hypothetical protein
LIAGLKFQLTYLHPKTKCTIIEEEGCDEKGGGEVHGEKSIDEIRGPSEGLLSLGRSTRSSKRMRNVMRKSKR